MEEMVHFLRLGSLSLKLRKIPNLRSKVYVSVPFLATFHQFDQFLFNFVSCAISSFFIAQQAVKAWIIENDCYCVEKLTNLNKVYFHIFSDYF